MADARHKGRVKLWITCSAVVLLLIVGMMFRHATRASSVDPSRIVRVARGNIVRSVVATGKIQPINRVDIKSKASGIVEKLYVDLDSPVHAGQLLAQLDEEEIDAQVAAQRAQQAAAQANVLTIQANIQQDKVNAAAPDLPMYKSTMERAQSLRNQGVVSQQATDDSQRDYLAALNKRDSSQAQIAVDQGKLQQARAQVQQSNANLKQLEEQRSYTRIVAPMDGVVLSRNVQVGDAVSSILVLGSAATLLLSEGDITRVYVQGKVNEADVASVYLGQPATIKVESFPGKLFSGTVTKIAPSGVDKDNVTTFEVHVSIDNRDGNLKANMTANAEILLAEHKNVLTLPESALVYDTDKTAFVQVPDRSQKGGTRKAVVRTGLSNGLETEIVGGLHQGDQVVLQ